MSTLASTTAATRVANTYELVEEILLQLEPVSPATVVKSQAVSKTFEHVYQRSQRLQALRKLNYDSWFRDSRHHCVPKLFGARCQNLRKGLVLQVNESEVINNHSWRNGGSWRSWQAFGTSHTNMVIRVQGEGGYSPRGCVEDDYDVKLSYKSASSITLGDVADVAVALQDLDGGGDFWWVKFYARSCITGPLDDENAMDYHKAMNLAWAVREQWKDYNADGTKKAP